MVRSSRFELLPDVYKTSWHNQCPPRIISLSHYLIISKINITVTIINTQFLSCPANQGAVLNATKQKIPDSFGHRPYLKSPNKSKININVNITKIAFNTCSIFAHNLLKWYPRGESNPQISQGLSLELCHFATWTGTRGGTRTLTSEILSLMPYCQLGYSGLSIIPHYVWFLLVLYRVQMEQ